MNVWAVTMVKDEADIIEHTVRHLDSEGITGILVADNKSTDGTHEILRDLKTGRQLDGEVHVVIDSEPGFYQARKMTDLARDAFSLGAEWVIPFDADELWYSDEGTIVDVIESTSRTTTANALYADLYNYFPTSTDDPKQRNPYLRITHRNGRNEGVHKVAIRRGPVELVQGNHDATGPPPFVTAASPLRIAHYPWRGWPRFKRKIVNGYAAYQATDLPPEMGEHWRDYGRILETQGEDALRGVYQKWFEDPAIKLEDAPAPWCRHTRS